MTKRKSIFLGKSELHFNDQKVKGETVTLEGELFYKISNFDKMCPFFMSVVSHSDHWLFISSTGALSAGRINSNYALFPYYTDDKISEAFETTGSKTIFLVDDADIKCLWEPFSKLYANVYHIERNLYKNSLGNKLIFEEINHDLELSYKYSWAVSEKYGFVRTSVLQSNSSESKTISVLDGIQNIIPWGLEEYLQNTYSNLVDAYKKNELDKDTGIGIYSLSAVIVDRAEPSEALKANLAWSLGLESPNHLITSTQVEAFRKGESISEEVDVRAERGAYFLSSSLSLEPNSSKTWRIVSDVNKSVTDVEFLKDLIKSEANLNQLIDEDITLGSENLRHLVAAADGLQLTEDGLRNIRHFSNTMFNIMRGGIFDNNYNIEKSDFSSYLKKANLKCYESHYDIVASLSDTFNLKDLKSLLDSISNPDFSRLTNEYLPLKFSRRHGDPSRPWNKFSINTKNESDGSKVLDYQGNWRDIFQNWEALVHSYPDFISGMITKFLNATTFDGYNPYRVTKGGFDWETIEPDNAWSYIGYWGDHQIIYLLKFLEFAEDYFPSQLEYWLEDEAFVYANVPYKIKDYESILNDSKNTVDYDFDLADSIEKRRSEIGADGALLHLQNGEIYHVNGLEKLIATLLSKLSNFIPEAGIWMNTQRPEWNDANNALVGNGVSMVTLYYIRRFLSFFKGIVDKSKFNALPLSKELATFFTDLNETFLEREHLLRSNFSDKERKILMDGLGGAGSAYREKIYQNGFSGLKQLISKGNLSDFLNLALKYVDHSIACNKREDGLYHAYNLMSLDSPKTVSVAYLSEMLEGQVAVLSSGYLETKESLWVLDAMKQSALFRPDQYTYILYPNKILPRFTNKNSIPVSFISQSKLIRVLVKDENKTLVEQDINGEYHFNGDFHNVDDLKVALSNLDSSYSKLIKKEQQLLETAFEAVFNHKAFTGRSGTFFGYEGLGSIYWHMVSKLLLAVSEVTQRAYNEGQSQDIIGKLFDHYFEINAGLGLNKSPELYGAFPVDAYSHTPAGKGVQQPGMTGQVKEDVLSRIAEIGVEVKEGCIAFRPILLRNSEYLKTPKDFNYVAVDDSNQLIKLNEGELAFTYCQIPVIYSQSSEDALAIKTRTGEVVQLEGHQLNQQFSSSIFSRMGDIEAVHVYFKK